MIVVVDVSRKLFIDTFRGNIINSAINDRDQVFVRYQKLRFGAFSQEKKTFSKIMMHLRFSVLQFHKQAAATKKECNATRIYCM